MIVLTTLRLSKEFIQRKCKVIFSCSLRSTVLEYEEDADTALAVAAHAGNQRFSTTIMKMAMLHPILHMLHNIIL